MKSRNYRKTKTSTGKYLMRQRNKKDKKGRKKIGKKQLKDNFNIFFKWGRVPMHQNTSPCIYCDVKGGGQS